MRRLFFELNVFETIQQCLQKLPPSYTNVIVWMKSDFFTRHVSPLHSGRVWLHHPSLNPPKLLRLILLLPPRRPLKGHLACPFEKHACQWPIHLPWGQRGHEYCLYNMKLSTLRKGILWVLVTVQWLSRESCLPIARWRWCWMKINEVYASKLAWYRQYSLIPYIPSP